MGVFKNWVFKHPLTKGWNKIRAEPSNWGKKLLLFALPEGVRWYVERRSLRGSIRHIILKFCPSWQNFFIKIVIFSHYNPSNMNILALCVLCNFKHPLYHIIYLKNTAFALYRTLHLLQSKPAIINMILYKNEHSEEQEWELAVTE